jgi:N-acyl-D-amino-acid deacylase
MMIVHRRHVAALAVVLFVRLSAGAFGQRAPDGEWQSATPESQGVSSQKLERLRQYFETRKTRAALVIRNGYIIGEWYWDGTNPDTRFQVYSVTKSFSSAAVGLLLRDRKLRLDQPAADFIPEWRGDDRRKITVRHLLTMTSGLRNTLPFGRPDQTAYAIQQPLEKPPGTVWAYNNGANQTLAQVVQAASGKELSAFLQERLFDPLEMKSPRMDKSNGKALAYMGLNIHARDLAKFGWLYLNGGVWNGKRLLDADFVRDSVTASQELNPEYGYLWWVRSRTQNPRMPPDSYSAVGLFGNYLSVFPSQKMVVVRLIGFGRGSGSDVNADEFARLALEAIERPVTGRAIPALQSFDAVMQEFMDRRGVPGGALAVVKDGRLVYARGYGYADLQRQTPVEPTSLFRIASVSKPITAAAIMKLTEDRRYRLSLDAKVFDLLNLQPHLTGGAQKDPRLREITVRHLLLHTGGWDRERSGDLMFRQSEAAQAMGTGLPPDHASLIRWAMGKPLDFAPGSRYAYSNFGYCLLGRVIEKTTGMPYEKYVQREVLAPMGIRRMRIGTGRIKEPPRDEVTYYDPQNRRSASAYSEEKRREVPLPYGFAAPETMDAHGGWIASVVDLARFAVALDRPGGRSVLQPETVKRMFSRPDPPPGFEPDGGPGPVYYAFGWNVRPVGTDGRMNVWHYGAMPGTFAVLVRRHDGLIWAAVFNQRSEGRMPSDFELDAALHRAADAVRDWSHPDQFRRYR